MHSCFQILPDHVIGLIYDYLLATLSKHNLALENETDRGWILSENPRYNDSSGLLEKNRTALLTLCRLWRNAVLSDILHKTEIDLQLSKNNSLFKGHSWPRHLKSLPTHVIAHYSRHIALHMDFQSVIRGTALEQLDGLLSKCVFINACSLELHLTYISGKADFSTSYTNMQKFLQRLAALLPNVSSVLLDLNIYFQDIVADETMLISRFIRGILAKASRVKYLNNYMPYDVGIELPNANTLSYLEFNWDINYSHFVQIMHQNRSSLSGLKITTVVTKELRQVFYSSDNTEIIYPSMRSFSLSSTAYDKIDKSSDIVLKQTPFPNLAALRLRCSFPFSDSTIFETRATLKSVSLCMSTKVAEIMLRHSNSGYKYLSHFANVDLSKDMDSIHSSDDLKEVTQLLSQIKESIQRLALTIYAYTTLSSEKHLLDHIQRCQSLKVLVISDINLGISCILSLLSNLSQLKLLRCRPANSDPLVDRMPDAEMPDYIFAHHRSSNPERAIDWVIQTNPYMFYKRVAKTILLLQIAYPRLNYLATDSSYAESYQLGIKECMDIKHYARHFSLRTSEIDLGALKL